MSGVWSCNEWDPLEEVIVGNPLNARYPTPDRSTQLAEFPDRSLAAIPRGSFPQQVIEETEEDLNGFAKILEGLGITVEPLVKSGLLKIEVKDPAELSPGHFISRVREEVEDGGASMVVIDSLNGLLAAMPGEAYLTIQLHELLGFLNNQGITSILVMAQYGILGQGMASPVDVSYLADTILLLRYFESRGTVRQAISVVKKRSGKHERTIRELQLGPERIRVGRPLTEFQGVLTGVPNYVGQAGPLMEANER